MLRNNPGNRDKGPSNLGASLGHRSQHDMVPRGGHVAGSSWRWWTRRRPSSVGAAQLTNAPDLPAGHDRQEGHARKRAGLPAPVSAHHPLVVQDQPLDLAVGVGAGQPAGRSGIRARRGVHPRAPRPWDFAPLSTRVQGWAEEIRDR